MKPRWCLDGWVIASGGNRFVDCWAYCSYSSVYWCDWRWEG